MARQILRRLLRAVAALIVVTAVVFTLLHVSGDPSYILLAPEATAEQRAAFRAEYGLDRPVWAQYGRYLGRLVQGDFGQSLSFQMPAAAVALARLPATLELTLAAMLLAIVISIPAAVLAAMRRGTLYDRLMMALTLLGQTVPTFWLGMVMILVLAVRWHLFPASGRGSALHLVMPATALALWLTALLARVTRSEMIEALEQDYVRTARAKGLAESGIAARHALKNALLPIITVIGLQFGGLLGGAVMTETVFAWPGVGTMILDAILKKDFPVVLAGVVIVAIGFIVVNLVLDLLYTVLDPRLRRA
ncbi:MAG TPA: ABC transporter permease [Candidatus Dormibacteraeota bacterium]|jgi:peptide/nickel transport system permease protein|nr:ABC transporter permease [Candidatus Dormibacteraeota bacterium]